MAATLTGTPTQVTWAAGANPAGQSITVPADATAVYMFWAYYAATNGVGLASATLGGASPSQVFEVPVDIVFDGGAVGVAAWYSPSTGSQTLDPAWDAAPSEGPVCIVAYVKGGNLTAWTDADGDHDESTNAVTATLTTVVGDLVLKFDVRTNSTAPGTSGSWTSAQTQTNNSESARLSYITAAGTSQVCNAENEDYSAMVAIAIPAAAGGGSSIAAISSGYHLRGMR